MKFPNWSRNSSDRSLRQLSSSIRTPQNIPGSDRDRTAHHSLECFAESLQQDVAGSIFGVMINVSPEDCNSAEAQALLSAFIEEVKERYEESPADIGYFDPALVAVSKSTFLVARKDGLAVGCGALVPIDERTVEIKRMFVLPEHRSHGVASAVLQKLQDMAREFDYDVIRLETGNRQPESIALYGKSGFYRIPNYPPYEEDPLAFCFEKKI
jgi:putative acetyltransferase